MEWVNSQPVEITKEQRNEILKSLTKKAKQYSRETLIKSGDLMGNNYCHWLSEEREPCYYNYCYRSPDWYHYNWEEGVIRLLHFLPKKCDQVCVDYEGEAICLVTVRHGNKYKFYLDSHPVGLCNWKRPRGY